MVFGCRTMVFGMGFNVEIEKEMFALCVLFVALDEVLLLLQIDVIMCLYGQSFEDACRNKMKQTESWGTERER